jgi:hypothetical protein
MTDLVVPKLLGLLRTERCFPSEILAGLPPLWVVRKYVGAGDHRALVHPVLRRRCELTAEGGMTGGRRPAGGFGHQLSIVAP